MATSTWLQYYQNRTVEEGDNPVKTLVMTKLAVFTSVTQSHLDKPDRFRSTISSNSPATMVLVPVGGGNVQLLHHGTLFSQGLGVEPIALFITGNRTSSPIKILNIEEACLEIGVGNSIATRAKSINTPDEDSFYECDSVASFQSLKGADKNNPLDDRPNHMLLHPRTFELAGGLHVIDAGELAWKVIDSINSAPDSTEEEMEELKEEKENANILLAYLWVITKSICRTVPVTDVGDADEALDAKCITIRAMLSGHDTGTGNGGGGGRGRLPSTSPSIPGNWPKHKQHS